MARQLLGRLVTRLLWGLLVALFLLGAMQIVANRVAPRNDGMSADPCPPPEGRLQGMARIGFLTLAGRPQELRDWADLCLYQRDNADLLAHGERPRAVFIGDSITQYWGQRNPAFFVNGIVNRGVAGQTSPQVLIRLTPDALALKPTIVHVLVGLNDITGARGPSRPEDYHNNIRAIVTLAKASGTTIVLGAVPPARNDAWGDGIHPVPRIRGINAWLSELAKREGLVFADYWTPMAAPDGTMRGDLSEDGAHPNLAGYAVMETVARTALAEAERRAPSR
ncbi:MAG: GDSL family lipase [Sphingomonadales bacterium]|nr:GDSL family lipase [Sphingomonadales bacterium]MBU3991032.1 GDSL family lipase [Alphaproteobacteria bacterium]